MFTLRVFGTTKSQLDKRLHIQKDSSKRQRSKKGVLTELQNRLWSSLWEVLTAESPNSLNKENKLVIQPHWRDVDSSYLQYIYFEFFTSFDSHLWDYPRQTSILHQPEFFAKFPKCYLGFSTIYQAHQLAGLKVSSHYESLENFYQMAARQLAIWQFLWG